MATATQNASMTRLCLALLLAAALTGCVVAPPEPPRDHTLRYEPHVDGAPVCVERGAF